MAPPPPPPRYAAGCGGDGCTARDPWPLHHVRHRSIFYRLCTSCVLKYNPSSFCSLCLSLLESPPLSPIVHCATCPMVSHLSCLPNPNSASQFVCPSCENGGARPVLFPKIDGKRKVIDVESSRVLLEATRLAAESMRRAAAGARAEVERKTKEAVVAQKRAREMLERNVVAGLRTAVEELKRKKKRLKGKAEKEKLNATKGENEKLLNSGQSGQEEKGQSLQNKNRKGDRMDARIARQSYEDFQPSFEWKEEEGCDTLAISIPGFTKEQIKLRMDNFGNLKLTGERPFTGQRWSRVRKEFRIPSTTRTADIRAKLENANLYVKFPKKSVADEMNAEGESGVRMRFKKPRHLMVNVGVAVVMLIGIGFYVSYILSKSIQAEIN